MLGFLIAYVRIPPWIATLAGYLAFRGLGTQILTKASETNAISIPSTDAIGELSDIFGGRLFETDWGEINIPCIIMGLIGIAAFAFLTISARRKKIVKGYQADPLWYVVTKLVLVSLVILFFTVEFSFDGGMPTVVLWLLGILILYGIVTEKTTIGRHFMTVGGNAIAACIVGGVSAYGGAGTVIGMVVGATLIGVINQGMSLIGVDQNWIKIVKGLVLLAAVVFEIFSKNSKAKASKTKTQKEKTAELEDAIAKAQEELEKASDEALNEAPAVPSAENVVTTES